MTTIDPLCVGWQASRFAAPAREAVTQTLPAALAAVAARRPDAPAVITARQTISFAELAARVGGLARQIADAAPPGPVAVLLPSGIDAVAAWFAVTLAGRPFVLLEPANPPARNHDLCRRAGARAVLCADPGHAIAGLAVLHPAGQAAACDPATAPGAHEPAMLFPTSGSTGEPKLIAYSAMSMMVRVAASIPLMRITPGARVVIAASHANYGYMHHALAFLLAGGTLVMGDMAGGGLAWLRESIAGHGARHVRFTPSVFRKAASDPATRAVLGSLAAARFSGEPLLAADLALARAVLAPDCMIQNVYGSTESGLFVWTDRRDHAIPDGALPIGNVYPGWEFSVRDAALAPVPVGEPGQLVLSGRCHALGDWTDGAVATERFPADPRGDDRRLYFTGDVVRVDAQGTVSLLGRNDRLVKINGNRVALDEVETLIRSLTGAPQVVVMVAPLGGSERMVAWVEADAIDVPAMRARLRERLPQAMMPARIEPVAAMPLLAGGKVDRAALLAALAEAGDDRPATYGSATLAALWADVLKIPGAHPDADFFSLGGDSLLLIELQALVERAYGRGFGIEAFLIRPTLRQLARLMGEDLPDDARPLRRGEITIRVEAVPPRGATGRGTALCMPGWGGGAMPELLAGKRLLDGFAVMTCDARTRSPTLAVHGGYIAVADQLAQAIAEGRIARPDVFVGYSLGGYIGWLAARRLAQRGIVPPRVLAIDTPAMHRVFRLGLARLRRRLGPPGVHRVTMFLICREAPPRGPDEIARLHWRARDAIIVAQPVRSLDHLEMAQGAITDAAAAAFAQFMADRAPGAQRLPPATGIATPGAIAADLLREAAAPDRARLDALLAEHAALANTETLEALVALAILHAPGAHVAALCQHARRAAPRSAALALAARCAARGDAEAWSPPRAIAVQTDFAALPPMAAIIAALTLRLGPDRAAAVSTRRARMVARLLTIVPRVQGRLRRLARWLA